MIEWGGTSNATGLLLSNENGVDFAGAAPGRALKAPKAMQPASLAGAERTGILRWGCSRNVRDP